MEHEEHDPNNDALSNAESLHQRVCHCIDECLANIREIPVRDRNGAFNTHFEYAVKQAIYRYEFTDADKDAIASELFKRQRSFWISHTMDRVKLGVSTLFKLDTADALAHSTWDKRWTREELSAIEGIFRDLDLA